MVKIATYNPRFIDAESRFDIFDRLDDYQFPGDEWTSRAYFAYDKLLERKVVAKSVTSYLGGFSAEAKQKWYDNVGGKKRAELQQSLATALGNRMHFLMEMIIKRGWDYENYIFEKFIDDVVTFHASEVVVIGHDEEYDKYFAGTLDMLPEYKDYGLLIGDYKGQYKFKHPDIDKWETEHLEFYPDEPRDFNNSKKLKFRKQQAAYWKGLHDTFGLKVDGTITWGWNGMFFKPEIVVRRDLEETEYDYSLFRKLLIK